MHWHYSPLWALPCRTMSFLFFLSATNSLHLLTPSAWRFSQNRFNKFGDEAYIWKNVCPITPSCICPRFFESKKKYMHRECDKYTVMCICRICAHCIEHLMRGDTVQKILTHVQLVCSWWSNGQFALCRCKYFQCYIRLLHPQSSRVLLSDQSNGVVRFPWRPVPWNSVIAPKTNYQLKKKSIFFFNFLTFVSVI